MSENQLPIYPLGQKELKQSLIAYLKGDPKYKDFNFEASGVSTLLNVMSQNTHIIGYYVKMLMDESFVDSAKTREALLSHAKRVGYTPRGRRAARAELKLKITVPVAQQPLSDSVIIPAGTSFTSTNSAQDSRHFYLTEDVIAKEKVDKGTEIEYSTPLIEVVEGKKLEWNFEVDSSVVDQTFVIKDPNVDVDTLRVFIRPNSASHSVKELRLASNSSDVGADALVYYITTNEKGLYQIFFGQGIYGFAPENGNIIECHYISCNGSGGNGSKVFRFNPPAPDPNNDSWVGNFSQFEVECLHAAGGGMEAQDIESLRHAIPAFHRRQDRLVTEEDFRDVLLEEFRNIDSLNVWGGEKNTFKTYGKIYCSLKPRNNIALSITAKEKIRENILKKYGIVGSDVEFVDPDYVNVQLTLKVTVDRSITNKTFEDIKRDLTSRAEQYSEKYLNKFDARLSELELLNTCKNREPWIKSIYSTKKIYKQVKVLYDSTGMNAVNFGNPLEADSVSSAPFVYADMDCRIICKNGKLFVQTLEGKAIIKDPVGEVDFSTGILNFEFPPRARVPGFAHLAGLLSLYATPANPDVETNLNNIVRIVGVKVDVK